jgi:hypothetical protein
VRGPPDLKLSNLAFLVSVIAGLSYISLYVLNSGYPAALVSILVGLFRILTSIPALINSKRSMAATMACSVIGLGYIGLVLAFRYTPYAILPLLLELATLFALGYLISRVGKTKQPSPLDMPVYG